MMDDSVDLFEELGDDDDPFFHDDEEDSDDSDDDDDDDASCASSSNKEKKAAAAAEKRRKLLSLRRRHAKRMTSRQELANAVTQLGPSAYFALALFRRKWSASRPIWWLVVAVWLHLPFSVAYHARCARRFDDPHFDHLRCGLRRLDNTFIHFSSTAIAYGTSKGSVTYVLPCATVNLLAAALHWTAHVNVPRNQFFSALAVFLYILPFYADDAARRDYFFPAFATFFLAGLTFRTYAFGGYSHAIFHLIMTAFAFVILNGALAVSSSEDDPSSSSSSSSSLHRRTTTTTAP